MKKFLCILSACALLLNVPDTEAASRENKTPVDYVNPYIGNISHLLVPTYPTVHLPNSMLRVYPERENFTGNTIGGLPLIVTSHRGSSAFNLSPYQGDLENATSVVSFGYDNEVIKPYFYSVDLDDYHIHVDFAPSHQAGIYRLSFADTSRQPYIIFNTRNGELRTDGKKVSGYQEIGNRTKVYICVETDVEPVKVGEHKGDAINSEAKVTKGNNAYYIMAYPEGTDVVCVRYGVSFISEEQAEKNLRREIKDFNLEKIAEYGKNIWNETLGKLDVTGGTDDERTVFYTSLYRTYERMICLSEDGKYFSAYDGKVHDDEGVPFYVDDWIWDTYRATHPLPLSSTHARKAT